MKIRITVRTLAALAGLNVLSVTRVAGQIIVNGGFESGSFSPGWSPLSDPQSGAHTLVTAGVDGIVPFAGGSFATFSNNAPLVSGIAQTFSTTTGQSYVLSYWFTNSADSDTSNEFKVTWNGSTVTDLTGFASLGAVWTNATFIVTGTGSDTLAFSGFQNQGWNGLDAVSLTAVPEPSSYAALLAVTVLGFARWRRQSHALRG
jgi:hypothetical protein